MDTHRLPTQSSSYYFSAGTILAGEAEQKKRRRSTNYPLEFKWRLARQACDESVSAAQLAMQHGLNTNGVFAGAGSAGSIEIRLGQTTICIRGTPDSATLALVLQGLLP
jgi:transposase